MVEQVVKEEQCKNRYTSAILSTYVLFSLQVILLKYLRTILYQMSEKVEKCGPCIHPQEVVNIAAVYKNSQSVVILIGCETHL